MPLLDCHCHLDRYDDPKSIATTAAGRGVFVVAMTNLPSHFRAGLPHVRRFTRVRLALGLHPLAAMHHANERQLFRDSLEQTSFVGEVGLDFSREGAPTREIQLASFRFVAECLSSANKVLSLHSRGAERTVLETLVEFRLRPSIFHWYSGPLKLIDEVVEAGHLFSVNPAMAVSQHGRKVIERIPQDRMLTESDGPYAKIMGRPSMPWDVTSIEEYLSAVWKVSSTDVRRRVWQNFRQLLADVGLTDGPYDSSEGTRPY